MFWWADWLVPLLVASGILLISRGGFVLVIILWLIYLGNGAKAIQTHPTTENELQFSRHLVIGIIVVIIVMVITIGAAIS